MAKVLLLDDNEACGQALWRMLRRQHDIRVATTVDGAFRHFDDYPPEVLLCDYLLGSETADDFLEIVATAYPSVRRIVLSACWRDGERAVRRGHAQSMIEKPATLETLLAAIAPPGAGPLLHAPPAARPTSPSGATSPV